MKGFSFLYSLFLILLFLGCGNARCKPHDLPFGQCPWCATAAKATPAPCPERGWPEALCFHCHPELAGEFKRFGDWCAEHGIPESQCLLCGASSPTLTSNQENQASCPSEAALIVLSHPAVGELAGFAEARPQAASWPQQTQVPGYTAWAPESHVVISARAEGQVVRVAAELGQTVEKGQILAWLDAPHYHEWRAAWERERARQATARARLEQDRQLAQSGLLPKRELQMSESAWLEASASLQEAERTLQAMGWQDPINRQATHSEPPSPEEGDARWLPVRAPANGVIVARQAVQGALVPEHGSLFALAQPKELVVQLNIPASLAAGVRLASSLRFATRQQEFQARLEWISPELDARTATVPARARLTTTSPGLRAGEWGMASIEGQVLQGVELPTECLQWEGCCTVVFQAEDAYRFRPIRVEVLAREQGRALVRSDQPLNGRIVQKGAFQLRTELTRKNIGAGCCRPME